eukprot:gene11352-18959_t
MQKVFAQPQCASSPVLCSRHAPLCCSPAHARPAPAITTTSYGSTPYANGPGHSAAPCASLNDRSRRSFIARSSSPSAPLNSPSNLSAIELPEPMLVMKPSQQIASYYSSAKYASIARLLIVVQPANLARMVARTPRAGPIGILFFFFGLLTMIFTTIRHFIEKKVRNCTCCKGYGIVRCSLCGGSGQVDWNAKCPMCMAKRYVDCPDCGGMVKRVLFPKASRNPPGDMGEPAFLRRKPT